MTYQMPPYVPENEDEEAFLADYTATLSKYPRAETTVDIVLLTIRDGDLCVLLVRRGDYPYRDRWALPGGFVNPDESLDEAAARELVEETNLDSPRGHLEQLGSYGDPGRDPRARVISIAYLGLLPDLGTPVGGDDAAEARFWRVADVVEEGLPLAFDHARILADALERAASKIEYTPLATAFCQPTFTLGELRRMYEAIWGSNEDRPNFHRKVLSTPGFVEPLGEREPRDGLRGRPGQLYRAGDATLLHPPLLRPTLREQVLRKQGDRPVRPVRMYEPDLFTGRLLRTSSDGAGADRLRVHRASSTAAPAEEPQ